MQQRREHMHCKSNSEEETQSLCQWLLDVYFIFQHLQLPHSKSVVQYLLEVADNLNGKVSASVLLFIRKIQVDLCACA